MTGQTLGQRYQVQKELGRGGVGQVLLARDGQLDREVAVKTLLEAQNELDQARFVEEARITGKLAHPNIVPVHTLDADGDTLFLVMKRVEGQDLKVLMLTILAGHEETVKAYPLRRLLRIFLKVCDAVGYAHSRGVIHRDLKPANVMLGAGDEPLVLDWGLAKPIGTGAPTRAATIVDAPEPELIRSRLRESFATRQNMPVGDDVLEMSGDITMEGSIVGTPAYMPPEQADSQAVLDQRADIYSLGAILYELLTCKAPYSGTTYQSLKALLTSAPLAPSRRSPTREIPAPLEAICLKAMARDADARYESAVALRDDVEAFLDGDRVEAYAEGRLEAVRRVARRHRVAVTTAAIAFLGINLLLGAATLLVLSEEEHVLAATQAREQQAQAAREQALAVENATRLASLTARSEHQASAALRALTRFRQRSDSSVPILKSELRKGSDLHQSTITDLHLEARLDLARCTKQIAGLIEAAGDQDVAPLRVFAREVDGLSRQLDRTLVAVLVARRPSQALLTLKANSLDVGPEAALLEARALLRLDRRTEALRVLTAAPAPPPKSALAAATTALQAMLTERPLSAQRAAFDAAIEADPLQAWLWLRRAEVHAEQGEFDAAERDYQQATKLQKVDGWIYSSRMQHTYAPFATAGLCRTMVGFIHRMAPENHQADVVADRAQLWRNGNLTRFAKRVEDRRAAKQISPRTALRELALGALLVRDVDALDRHAQALLALDPEERVGLACRARVAIARGRPQEALTILKPVLAKHPEDAGIQTAQGLALLRAHKPREAIAHLAIGARSSLVSDPWRWLAEAVVATKSEDPELLEQGVAAARRGLSLDPLAALSYFPRARPVPADPRLHRVLGQLRRRQRRPAAAALHHMRAFVFSGFQKPVKALGLDLSDALAVGELHEELGLRGEAWELYRWAARDPKLTAESERRRKRIEERR